MPAASDSFLSFPSFTTNWKDIKKPNHVVRIEVSPDDDLFSNPPDMASPTPFIKDEPDDMRLNRFVHNGFAEFGDQFQNSHPHNSHQNSADSINPSDLTVNMNHGIPSHNMSSSFIMGNSVISDDELLSLGNLDDPNNHHQYGFGEQNTNNTNNMQHFYEPAKGGVAIKDQIYSSTPDGAPIQSPFIHGFNYAHFQPQQPQRPGFPAEVQNGIYSQSHRVALERQSSDSRSPMNAHTGMNNLHIGTPESSSYPIINHHHQKSGQWDHTPGSAQSWLDSPMASPHNGALHHHPQISEIIASGKHASLPAKVDNHGGSAYTSQEAKRKKRRESHNAVERRRRDNINERIHDLSRLVPQHRLEDEKVRKHIHNNGPLSPSIATSPPHATSLLAGGTGRRAAGNITTGLPLEEKDKGPNKGDILNGSVSWTRDLMWALYTKFEQEETLKKLLAESGQAWPFEEREEDARMKSELIHAVEKNGIDNFAYTRGPGSGLRVPGHTNVAGDPLPSGSSPQGLSPAMQSGGSGSNSGGPFWMQNGYSLKEEDEYEMEMS